ncbi:PPOX class F420-dependent oxidoreductase [Pseudonocardia sp. H11422]|uniref:PPOX class F420-dependent oxidoreductase n=1 Tax=Pseudonocardia sp. H11422 TaxID=2835866 RepID=UPI00292EF5E4|nr:PPOX class F420-dependent oxidoreductase [Pseudonocardia sp. H11422]
MSPEQIRGFLTEGTRTAKLGTVRRDGTPHVVPVWLILDGDDLLLTTGVDSVKGRAIRRDPRVAACVDDERPPYAFVSITGQASVSQDAAAMLDVATRIAARYVGPERAEQYGRLNSGPGLMLVRITPQRMLSEVDVTGL